MGPRTLSRRGVLGLPAVRSASIALLAARPVAARRGLGRVRRRRAALRPRHERRGPHAASRPRSSHKAERGFQGARPPAQAFSAGVAAYVYGLAPLSVDADTVPRFPRNQIVSIGELVDPTVRTVVLPEPRTRPTRSAAIELVGRPAGGGRARHRRGATTCSSSWTPTRTRSPTSAGAPPARKPGRYVLVPPGYTGALPAGVKRDPAARPTWSGCSGRTLVKDPADMPAVAAADGRLPAHGARRLDRRAARQTRSCWPGFPPMLNPLVHPEGARPTSTSSAQILASEPAAEARRLRAEGVRARRASDRAHAVHAGHRRRRAASTAAAKAGTRIVDPRRGPRERATARAQQRLARLPGRYIGDYGRNYLGRAVIATFALGANTAPETVYPPRVDDVAGRPLSGRHRYRIRFARGKLPPADAFWSVTMYGTDALPACRTRSTATRSATARRDCAGAATAR